MHTSGDIINMINGFPVPERLLIIEQALKKIREEEVAGKAKEDSDEGVNYEHPILSLAGILSEEEANEMRIAIEESRKIDKDEW